jgi:hypothetical protein
MGRANPTAMRVLQTSRQIFELARESINRIANSAPGDPILTAKISVVSCGDAWQPDSRKGADLQIERTWN